MTRVSEPQEVTTAETAAARSCDQSGKTMHDATLYFLETAQGFMQLCESCDGPMCRAARSLLTAAIGRERDNWTRLGDAADAVVRRAHG